HADTSSVLESILTLTSNFNYKLILDLIDEDYLSKNLNHFKATEFSLSNNGDIDTIFSLIGNIKTRTDLIKNFIEKGKSDNLEDNISLIIKEDEEDDDFKEVLKDYIDSTLSRFREY